MATEEQRNNRVAEEHATMWMDPSKMDEKARKYWEFNHGDIWAKICAGSNNGGDDNGGSVGHGLSA